MSIDNKQGEAEPSPASDGSVEPAAWEVYWEGAARGPYLVSAKERPSDEWVPPPRCVPLYRQPQPTLTDAERDAIDRAACAFEYDDDSLACAELAATLRGLLERFK